MWVYFVRIEREETWSKLALCFKSAAYTSAEDQGSLNPAKRDYLIIKVHKSSSVSTAAEGPWNHAAKLEKFPGSLFWLITRSFDFYPSRDHSCGLNLPFLWSSWILQIFLSSWKYMGLLVHISLSSICLKILQISRLMKEVNYFMLAADVEFSAIVDPNTELAHQRIADLQKGKYAEKWSKTKVFPHYRELLNSPVRFIFFWEYKINECCYKHPWDNSQTDGRLQCPCSYNANRLELHLAWDVLCCIVLIVVQYFWYDKLAVIMVTQLTTTWMCANMEQPAGKYLQERTNRSESLLFHRRGQMHCSLAYRPAITAP